jgi:hypothetical protein
MKYSFRGKSTNSARKSHEGLYFKLHRLYFKGNVTFEMDELHQRSQFQKQRFREGKWKSAA